VKKSACLGIVPLAVSLASCGSGDNGADSAATTTDVPAVAATDTAGTLAMPAHAKLVADHHKMEEDHAALLKK
jgi:hypothetical protein